VATASDARAIVQQALARLRGGNDTSAWIAISTHAGLSRDAATRTLAEFLKEMGEPLGQALLATAQR
jgi:hypothetical protein